MITLSSTFVNDSVIDYGHRDRPYMGPSDGVWGRTWTIGAGRFLPVERSRGRTWRPRDRGGGVVEDPVVSPGMGHVIPPWPPEVVGRVIERVGR